MKVSGIRRPVTEQQGFTSPESYTRPVVHVPTLLNGALDLADGTGCLSKTGITRLWLGPLRAWVDQLMGPGMPMRTRLGPKSTAFAVP